MAEVLHYGAGLIFLATTPTGVIPEELTTTPPDEMHLIA
jgi:hypothetical protein